MIQILRLFKIGLRQITRDGMLLVLLPAPVLIGCLFKFVVPIVNDILIDRLSFTLSPWYGFMDALLICLTPMFTAMISAFLMLEEKDEGIVAFYQISPAGGHSYLTARIGLPILWAFCMTVAITAIFNISGLSMLTIVTASLVSALSGIVMAMALVSLAGNRIEGLALSRIMSIYQIGVVLVWFAPKPVAYASAFLPSYWIGRIIMDGVSLPTIVIGAIVCVVWLMIFFIDKVSLLR